VSTIPKLGLALLIFLVLTAPALAVEGAVGRTLPGVWIQPQGGVVGPEPGLTFTTMPIGYMGAIGGGRLVPEAGAVFTNVDVNISANYLMPQYVYKTESPGISLASMFLAPIMWVGTTGSLQGPNNLRKADSANASLGDVIAVPVMAGFHFSENNNLTLSAMIFAPTGQFRPGNLSNTGMGEWTVMPNFAHTYLWKKRGLEVDNFVGFDIYGQNSTTKYNSGTMFHWDGMITQYLSQRLGFGVILSNMTQLNNDSGPGSRLLRGFEGRLWGVGANALYVAKIEKPGIILQLRWVNEFAVTNLMKGNVFLFGCTFKFN
jgi:hypothetical protein